MNTPQRIAACVEYCGVNYCGWQFQLNADSVQAQVERAISRVANHDIRVIAAGRTDSGVHGSGQVIHFDTTQRRDGETWVRGVNAYLPSDISLLWAQPVELSFHARFSALQRSYRYVILNRAMSPSYLHARVAWHPLPLAVARMQQAAAALLGRHDFSAFRAASCQSKNPHKTVTSLQIEQRGAWIWLDIRADGFLQRMVRNIVGVLLRIGEGREAVEWAAQLLAERERSRAAATAPAAGLYFTEVQYAPRFNLPPSPKPCRFW